jgi:hypothetical protein
MGAIFTSRANRRAEIAESGSLPSESSGLNSRTLPFAAAVRQLSQLNRRYLTLLPSEGGLPDTVRQHLQLLPDTAVIAVSECPFSLFTLEFDDTLRWLSMLDCVSGLSTPGRGNLRDDHDRSNFVVTALFFVWHLTHSNPLAAKVLFAVDESLASALQRFPLAQLFELSVNAVEWLHPRWPQHHRFWPDLVRNARESDDEGLRSTRLLGRQLLAAESLGLAPSCLQTHGAAARIKRQSLVASRTAAYEASSATA